MREKLSELWSGIQCFSEMTFCDFVFNQTEVFWDLIANKITCNMVNNIEKWKKIKKQGADQAEEHEVVKVGDTFCHIEYFCLHLRGLAWSATCSDGLTERDLESTRKVERENV